MLEARDLKKQFRSGADEQILFEHLNFSAREGEFVVITGRSGSGKSTLLYLLGLLDTPNAGTVSVDGVVGSSLSRHARADLRLLRFGYVFQDYGLMPDLSALDNVMLPLIMRGLSTETARDAALASLTRVGLGDRSSYSPSALSGGQQQRVSIARAIAHNPSYILADEPTANLDSANALQILQMFGTIHQAGTTIVMVTHEKESIALASRILNLEGGRLLESALAQSPSALPGDL
uniref:Lipoprotein releasing system ATP-binding protein LolD n=1 Tax=uncultured bacterium CSLC2 TaxID=1091571 RepID=Q8KP06_9BACT|nr:lipoprotein releasing system ATP-binding protein LolD [uncultured bacterium CSLC2]